MFRHFVGNIYILEEPPSPADTQLELTFPDELLADVDDEQYKKELTKEQLAKLLQYKEDMAQILGQESFDRLRGEGVLISGDTELIAAIALAMRLLSSGRFFMRKAVRSSKYGNRAWRQVNATICGCLRPLLPRLPARFCPTRARLKLSSMPI